MRKQIHALGTVAALLGGADATAAVNFVELQTNLGTIEVELFPAQAPVTVNNFLTYIGEGFYRNTLIHRVVADFVIQGGGFDLQGKRKSTHEPIPSEAANQLSNLRGTIAMARTNDSNSATSQFFLNTKDNPTLDYNVQTGNAGYAVFGKVIRGLVVVDQIGKLPTFQEFPFTSTNSTVFIEATYTSETQDPNNAYARVLLAGTGKGRVTSDPQGLDCGTNCSAAFTAGTNVRLIAKAAKGSVFSGWRGDCQGPAARIPLDLSANHNCAAVFTRRK